MKLYKITLWIFSALVLITNVDVRAQSSALNCNEPTPWTTGVTAGLVFDASNCSTCGTEVIDTDLNNFHSISTLLSSGFATVEDPTNTYAASTTEPYFVGYNFTESTLLNLDLLGLLNNVTISTYNNGTLVESESGSNLSAIGVGLLSQTRITGGFITTQPFDEVRISFGLGLLSSYHVYYPVIQKFCAAPLVDGSEFLECNTPTIQSVPDYPLYINSQELGVSGLLDADAGVTNPDSVIDADTSNFAQMYSLAGVASTVTLPVANALDEYPANTFAGFVIEKPGILGVNVLDQLTVSTYSNGTLVESASGASGLADVSTGLLYGQTGKQTVGFVSTQAFDEVRLSFTPVVGLLNTVNVYSLVTTRTCALTLQCEETIILTNPETPAFVNFQETGVGTACVGCQMEDVDFVTNTDTADAAELVLTAGLLGSITLSVQDPANTYPAGSLAGFVVESGTSGLLVLDLLENVTITTFLDGVQVESQSAGNLLDLELLGLLGSQQVGKRAVGFYTTQDFDEIKIGFGGLVNAQLLSTLNVYYAFVETSLAGGGGVLNCCPMLALPSGGSNTQNVFIGESISPLQAESSLHLDKGVQWVLFSTQQTGSDMYTGGIVLDSTTADEVTDATTFSNIDSSYFVPEGTYNIYMIPTGTPADAACRPFVEFVVNIMATKPDMASGALGTTIAGDVSTNDPMPAGTTYGNLTADAGNPSTDVPTLNSDGTFTFTTNTPGKYVFEIEVCDPSTPSKCRIETLEIDVFEAPTETRNPIANNDIAIVQGNPNASPTLVVPVLDNDAPGNTGGTLGQPTVDIDANNGTTSINANGELEYVPDSGFYGVDTVQYEVCETPSGLCDTALVIITVAEPSAPIAVQASDDLSSSKKGETVTVSAAGGLLTNDFTTGTGPLAVTPQNTVIPGVGSLTVGPDGSFIFTPNANFVGSYAQPYEVCDNGVCNNATLNLVVEENVVYVNPKVLLEGPYNSSSTMNNNLGDEGNTSRLAQFALNQPYASFYSYNGLESVSSQFFVNNTDIVDWILIELRDENNSSTVVFRRAAFVRVDGSVVDTNGEVGIYCKGIEPGNYYISIRHRNHLGVMSGTHHYLDQSLTLIDFTNASISIYGTNAMEEVEPGIFALHMGNALTDGILKFTGSDNDKAVIGQRVNSTQNLLNTVLGYEKEDLDLNGVVSFTGSNNDKAKLGLKLNTQINLLNTITEQLP